MDSLSYPSSKRPDSHLDFELAFLPKVLVGPWTPRADTGMAAAVARLQGRLERSQRHARRKAMRNAKGKMLEQIRLVKEEEMRRQVAAVTKLAALFRAKQAMKQLQKLKAEKQRRLAAAIRIQAMARMWSARKLRLALLREQEAKLLATASPALRYRRRSAFTPALASGVPERWRPGLELPLPDLESLWELLASAGRGQICTAMAALDLLQSYTAVWQSGLSELMAAAAPAGDLTTGSDESRKEHVRDGVAPQEVWPRQFAALLKFFNAHRDAKPDRWRLCELIEEVFDPCGEMELGFAQFDIDHETSINLKVFKQLIRSLTILLCLDESWIIAHFLWHQTGEFEMSPDLGHRILEKVFHRVDSSPRISQADFYRLCYAFDMIDPRGRTGIRTSALPVIFAKTLRKMPDFFLKRFESRPIIQGLPKLDMDSQTEKQFVQGWTEFSILMHATFAAMPTGMFKSPLSLCLLGLSRARQRPRGPI